MESLLSYNEIDINKTHEYEISNTILTSLKNSLNKKTRNSIILENKINININYSKIIDIVHNLLIFPNDLEYILKEYMTDTICIEYSACVTKQYDNSVGGIIEYKAFGHINCEKITFGYRQPITIYSTSKILGYYSAHGKNQMSFLNETFTNTNNEPCSADDHVEFLNFYTEAYFNKQKYLYNDNTYRYGYFEKHNTFYGKQTIFDDDTNKIITYNIIRTVTNEDHLITAAKIIRKLDKILHKVCKKIQNTLK